MADNYVAQGKILQWTNSTGSAVSSGDPVLIGDTLGVALTDIAAGASGSVQVKEVFSVRKVSGAISQGANLYWDADGNPVSGTTGSGALTTTSTGNTYAGKAYSAAGSSATTVEIDLNA